MLAVVDGPEDTQGLALLGSLDDVCGDGEVAAVLVLHDHAVGDFKSLFIGRPVSGGFTAAGPAGQDIAVGNGQLGEDEGVAAVVPADGLGPRVASTCGVGEVGVLAVVDGPEDTQGLALFGGRHTGQLNLPPIGTPLDAIVMQDNEHGISARSSVLHGNPETLLILLNVGGGIEQDNIFITLDTQAVAGHRVAVRQQAGFDGVMSICDTVYLEVPQKCLQVGGGSPANPGSHDVVVSNGQIAHRGQLIALGNIRNSGGVQVVFPGGHAQGVGISDLFLSDHVHKSDGHHSAFGGAAGQENGRLFEVVDPLDAVVIQHEILIIRHAGMERFPVSCHSIVIGGIFLSINSDNAVIALNPQTVALQRPGTVNQSGGQRLMALGGAVHLQVPQEALQLVILGGDPADGDRDNTIFNQQVAGPGQLIVFGDPLGVNLGGVHVVGVGIHSHGVSAADFPIGHLVKEADRDVSRDALEHCGKGNISFTVIPEHMLNHVGQSSICGQCAIGIAVIIPMDELIAVLGDGLQDGIVGVILLRHGYGVRLYTFQPIKVALCIVDLVAHRERAVLLDKDRNLAVLGSGRIRIILRKHVSPGRGKCAQRHGLIVGGNSHVLGAARHHLTGGLIHKHDLEGRLLGIGLLSVDSIEADISCTLIVTAVNHLGQGLKGIGTGILVSRGIVESPAVDLLVIVLGGLAAQGFPRLEILTADQAAGIGQIVDADLLQLGLRLGIRVPLLALGVKGYKGGLAIDLPTALGGVLPGQGDGPGNVAIHLVGFAHAIRAAVSLDIGTALHGDGAGDTPLRPIAFIALLNEGEVQRDVFGGERTTFDPNRTIAQDYCEFFICGLCGEFFCSYGHSDRIGDILSRVDVGAILFQVKLHILAIDCHAADRIPLAGREGHGLRRFILFNVLVPIRNNTMINGAYHGIGDRLALAIQCLSQPNLDDYIRTRPRNSLKGQLFARNRYSEGLICNRSGQGDAGDVLHRNVVIPILCSTSSPDIVDIIVIGVSATVGPPAVSEVVRVGRLLVAIDSDRSDPNIRSILFRVLFLQNFLLKPVFSAIYHMIGRSATRSDLDGIDGHVRLHLGICAKILTSAVIFGVPAHKVLRTDRRLGGHGGPQRRSRVDSLVGIIIPDCTTYRLVAESHRADLWLVNQAQRVIAISNLVRTGPGESIAFNGDCTLIPGQFDYQLSNIDRSPPHTR